MFGLTCSSDAMYIVLNCEREGVVDYIFNAWNIQTPSGNVGGH
jgi:hypothetical protein